MSSLSNTPWLIIGDFNEISQPSEKFGEGPPSEQKMKIFNTFLNSCNLLDLGFIGTPFTWTNGRLGNQIVRTCIDRAHANFQWLSLFLDSKVFHLPRPRSNHCPILLKTLTFTHKGQKPFCFESMWMNHPDFKNIVANCWNQQNLTLHDIIIRFSNILTLWNKETFWNIYLLKKRILARLAGIQKALSFSYDNQLLNLEKTLQDDYAIIL